MRKKLLILATFANCYLASKAQVVNTSFEHWDNITVNSQSIDLPRGWHSSNIGLDFYIQYNINPSTIPIKKVSPGNSGNYALKLEQYILNGDTIPGFIVLNYYDFSVQQMPAAPYNQSPASFSIYVKPNIVPNDTAYILSQLFRWNGTQREAIAQAGILLTSSNNSTTFQQHTANFTYYNSNTPDSIIFFVVLGNPDNGSSSGAPAFIGTELIIDDINILGGTQNAPPAAPSNLTYYFASVHLNWQDNSNNEDGFIILRSSTPINFEIIDTVGANVTSYVDNNVTIGNMYFYKVYAYNSLGVSNPSNMVSFIYTGTSSVPDYSENIIFSIFPNPNQGQFTIQTEKGGVFELMDITGKVINTYTITNNVQTINVNLPAGMYFIREKQSGSVKKIIVE